MVCIGGPVNKRFVDSKELMFVIWPVWTWACWLRSQCRSWGGRGGACRTTSWSRPSRPAFSVWRNWRLFQTLVPQRCGLCWFHGCPCYQGMCRDGKIGRCDPPCEQIHFERIICEKYETNTLSKGWSPTPHHIARFWSSFPGFPLKCEMIIHSWS